MTDTSLDNDSFSSDSDDEYLAMQQKKQQQQRQQQGTHDGADREAMVRKKLLESFYGKSTGINDDDGYDGNGGKLDDDQLSRDTVSDDDDDDDNHDLVAGNGAGSSLPRVGGSVGSGQIVNLDAPSFDVVQHTQTQVWNTSLHPLLETEEALACQVRTLDSRLQTLVYENYSRFIEATDAMKHIGESVQHHQTTMATLQGNMTTAQNASRSVEMAVGSLRDQVVEKMRVKRLLQRLDTVLKLPTTLRKNIDTQQYKSATQSYISASTILSKHATSSGFESLQRIQTDCQGIMTELVQDTSKTLYHWSGGIIPSQLQRTTSDGNYETDDDDAGYNDEKEDNNKTSQNTNTATTLDYEEGPLPDPPQSIAEIMECTAVSVWMIQHQQLQQALAQQQQQQLEEDKSGVASTPTTTMPIPTHLTLSDCQEMALSACLRFLERILDMHHIELQEHLTTSTGTSAGDPTTSDVDLIPTRVLEGILEVATLYTSTFHRNERNIGSANTIMEAKEEEKEKNQPQAQTPLEQFISTAFGYFLGHVRGELLEQAMLQQQHVHQAHSMSTMGPSALTSEDSDTITQAVEAEAKSDQYDEHIAASMAALLVGVRQLASGLLSLVGNSSSSSSSSTSFTTAAKLSPELPSRLVEQTIGLTEAMVRQRVDQKFVSLQLRVIEECLTPFCQSMKDLNKDKSSDLGAEEAKDNANDDENQPLALLGAVQLASVALSDALQLMDDTVRSILITLEEDEEGEENESGHVREREAEQEVSTQDDDSMLRKAVIESTRRFGYWLASVMEMIAGYESSTDPSHILEAPLPNDGTDNTKVLSPVAGAAGVGSPSKATASTTNMYGDHTLGMSPIESFTSDDVVENAIQNLLLEVSQPHKYMVLAIAEMCRVAERSVSDNIRQSITEHSNNGSSTRSGAIGGSSGGGTSGSAGGGVGGGGLFTGEESRSTRHRRSDLDPMSQRFHIAACRILLLFAMNLGHGAACLLSTTLPDVAAMTKDPEGPRDVVSEVLELMKETSRDCADLFGGDLRAGPIPESLEDEYISLTSSRRLSLNNHQFHNSTSLAFDVERMFVEKVVIYPHPSEVLNFQSSSILTLLLKVAFKGLSENARLLQFTISGYRQLKTDMEFVKWFVPHFIKDESMTSADGSNNNHTKNSHAILTSIMNESLLTVKDRCLSYRIDDGEGRSAEEETNRARGCIRSFMAVHYPDPENPPSFCIL